MSTHSNNAATELMIDTQPINKGFILNKYAGDHFGFTKDGQQYTLIDTTWSLGTLPLAESQISYSFVGNNVKISLTKDKLLSTPSDMRTILTSNQYVNAAQRRAAVETSLAAIGRYDQAVVRTITDFLSSGRFNSAFHDNGAYDIDNLTSIIDAAFTANMTTLVELAICELAREFFGRQMGQGGQPSPCHITSEQIENLCSVGRSMPLLHAMRQYVVMVFYKPEGQMEETKVAIEECLKLEGNMELNISKMCGVWLAQMVEKWPNAQDAKWQTGEMGRLREALWRYVPMEEVVEDDEEDDEYDGE